MRTYRAAMICFKTWFKFPVNCEFKKMKHSKSNKLILVWGMRYGVWGMGYIESDFALLLNKKNNAAIAISNYEPETLISLPKISKKFPQKV